MSEFVPIAWFAGREVPLETDDVRGPLRRALLLLAAGGDPLREPELDGRAVTALADELDRPELRAALEQALRSLRDGADALVSDSDLAWRAFAAALLADELAGE